MDADPLEELVALLARRHALPLLWLLRGGPQSFGVLVAAVGAPAPQVSQRLRELREAGFCAIDEGGDYRLSAEGRRLQGVLEPMAALAQRWVDLTRGSRVPRGSATHGRGEPA